MTTGFLTPLDVRQLEEPSKEYPDGLWELTSPMEYATAVPEVGDARDGLIYVPRGFLTDFASVPRVPVAWLIAGGVGNRAAVVHDWLYQTHSATKEHADAVLYEALLSIGVPNWRAWAMWRAVAWWGDGPYETGPARRKV